MRIHRAPLVSAISLLLLGLLVFGRSLTFDFVPYDDPAYVTENRFVNEGLSLEGLRWAFLYGSQLGDLSHQGVENLWHPLTWVSHMLDVEVFGMESAWGHHAVNLLFYLLTSLLVMWVAGMVLKNHWAGFFVALLWMVHPLKAESVAWVTERKDVLSGFFFWATLGCMVRGFEKGSRWRWIGYGCFVAALLSKPSVVVLPALILLVEGFVKGEEKWGVSFIFGSLKRWWLWWVTAAMAALVSIMMQAGGSHDYFIGQSSFVDRMMTAGLGFWLYCYRILVPWNLAFD